MGRTASASVEARPTLASVWWTLALLLLTTAGLGLLAWALLVTHGMAYATFEVVRPRGVVVAPHLDDYVRALLVAVTTNVAVALALVWLARRTRARRWHPIAVGVLAAVTAVVLAGSTLLLLLGISPIAFVLAL
ncbi:hypothetical protein [uncultured Ornithinimicrobium sp.]|uniref:hypothetical protein n=1 Tax=uncultured Ornithinimicrobium sp. TaxID=259307 RepID=UPI002597576A|nr:hypothetical protein [uncultured Ornithinimicrobium sp.]